MTETKEVYQEWDEIFKEREKYLQENPEARDIERPKKFKDEDNNLRCTKCGSTDDIGGCIDCRSEENYLEAS